MVQRQQVYNMIFYRMVLSLEELHKMKVVQHIIYIAFAEHPFVSSKGVPVTAR
jgi:hypothetical protein